MARESDARSLVVYQADPDHVKAVKGLREKLHEICKSRTLGRYVRVEMLDGVKYEGTIVHVDGGHVYLQLEPPNGRYAIPPVPPTPPIPPTPPAYGGFSGVSGAGYAGYQGFPGTFGTPGSPVPRPPYYPGPRPPYYPVPHPPYYPGAAILPLVLYDLLAITLI